MNPYFIAGSVVAVVMAYGVGHWQGDDAGQDKVQAKWDQEKAKLAEEYATNVAKMRDKEQAMQASADRLRQENAREIKEINARATALSNSLRNRPERPEGGGVSQTASTGQSGCSGKDLYRESATDIVKLATDADELRVALKQCYAQYDSIGR